jgi:GAF domain-containing protein
MEQWERLLDELRDEFIRREEEFELLHEIDMQLLQSERPLSVTFDFIVRRTQELLGSDLTVILLRRGRRLENVYSVGEQIFGQHLPLSLPSPWQSLMSGKILNIQDTADPQFAKDNPLIEGDPTFQIRSLMAAPVDIHGIMVGTFFVGSVRPGAFKHFHERIFVAIADQIAIALQRAQLLDQNRLFSEVDQLIFTAGDSQQVMQAALKRILDELQALEHVELCGAQIMFLRGNWIGTSQADD